MFSLGEVVFDGFIINKNFYKNDALLCPKISMFENRYKIEETEIINISSIEVFTLEKCGNGYRVGDTCKETSYSIRDGYVIPDQLAEKYLIKYDKYVDGTKIVNESKKFPDATKIDVYVI